MRLRLAILLLTLASLVGVTNVNPTTARAEGIEVRSQTAANRFPDGIQFTVFLASSAEINSVRLRYRVLPDGVNVTVRPTCTSGTSINCNALVGSTATSYMVPGAEVTYFWEVEDAGGAKLTTPESRTSYEDTRFKWESTKDGNITVYYYSGNEQSNATVLRTARETVDKFSQLEGTRVTFPLKVWVYGTARDLQPAVASQRFNGSSNSVQTLGEVSASDTALVSRDTDFLNIVRHEVTHIVTRAATQGGLSEMPIWINEGLSTYAQKDLLPGEQMALELAIKRNRALPLVSLGASARGSADQVSIFYAQSGSVVGFMVDKLGPDKFAPFVQALKADTLDAALTKIYGFDLTGLENAWRKDVGLPPIDASAGGSSGGSQNAIPTLVPFGAQGSGSSSSKPTPSAGGASSQQSSKDGSDDSLPVIVGGVALVIVLAGAGFYMTRRRTTKSS